METINHKILFSLDRPENPASEATRHAVATLLDAAPCLGMYQGTTENSFMVDFGHLNMVKALAKHFKQESILVISDGIRLVYLDTDRVDHIGKKLTPVSDLTGLDAWTLIDGVFYVAE